VGPLGNGELATSIVVQGFFGRSLVVEVDGLRWGRNEARVVSSTPFGTQTFHRHRSGSAVGASLLFRTKPRRASWFGGGGIAMLETFEHDRYVIEGCVPTPSDPRRCDNLTVTTNTPLKAGLIGLGVGAAAGCVLAVSYGGDAIDCVASLLCWAQWVALAAG
jgi:hypothetical protein